MTYTNKIHSWIVTLLAAVSIGIGCQRETELARNSTGKRTPKVAPEEPSELTVDDDLFLDHKLEPFDEDLELEWVEIEEVPIPIINEKPDGEKIEVASTNVNVMAPMRQRQNSQLLNKLVLTPDGSARFRFPVDADDARVSLGPVKTKTSEIMYMVATYDNISFMAMQKPDTKPLPASIQDARREMERRRDEAVTLLGDKLIESEIVTDDGRRKIELTFSRKGNDRTPAKLIKSVTYFANSQTYSLSVITKFDNPAPDKAREFFDSFRPIK